MRLHSLIRLLISCVSESEADVSSSPLLAIPTTVFCCASEGLGRLIAC